VRYCEFKFKSSNQGEKKGFHPEGSVNIVSAGQREVMLLDVLDQGEPVPYASSWTTYKCHYISPDSWNIFSSSRNRCPSRGAESSMSLHNQGGLRRMHVLEDLGIFTPDLNGGINEN
jgi:hypothetical protein